MGCQGQGHRLPSWHLLSRISAQALDTILVFPGRALAGPDVCSWARDGSGIAARSASRLSFPHKVRPHPRPPSAPHQDGPVLFRDPALLLAAEQVAHGGPEPAGRARRRRPAATVLRRPTAAARRHAPQNAKQFRPLRSAWLDLERPTSPFRLIRWNYD